MANVSPYLDVQHLTKSFGSRVLFDDISFGIAEGQKGLDVSSGGRVQDLGRRPGGALRLSLYPCRHPCPSREPKAGASQKGIVAGRDGKGIGEKARRPSSDRVPSAADLVWKERLHG